MKSNILWHWFCIGHANWKKQATNFELTLLQSLFNVYARTPIFSNQRRLYNSDF
jgi:hypothetical protein